MRTQRALTAAAVSPGGLLGILAAHREATGRAGVVVDLLGRVLAQATCRGGDHLVERMSGRLDSVRDRNLPPLPRTSATAVAASCTPWERSDYGRGC